MSNSNKDKKPAARLVLIEPKKDGVMYSAFHGKKLQNQFKADATIDLEMIEQFRVNTKSFMDETFGPEEPESA